VDWRAGAIGDTMTTMTEDEAMLGVDAENPTGALGLYQSLGFEVNQPSITYRRSLGD
jgi:ribosomal protein S18 acetylase RimI-like enzyme